jgi:hypothetical protein
LASRLNIHCRSFIGGNRFDERTPGDASVGREQLPPLQRQVGMPQSERTVKIPKVNIIQRLGKGERVTHRLTLLAQQPCRGARNNFRNVSVSKQRAFSIEGGERACAECQRTINKKGRPATRGNSQFAARREIAKNMPPRAAEDEVLPDLPLAWAA